MTIKNVVSIAGTDPTGGAGIHADLKAFSAMGAYDIVRLFWIHRQLQCQRPVDLLILGDLHPLHRELVVNR